MADMLARLTRRERRALEGLAETTGVGIDDLACEMVAAYLRLCLDAPAALPGRPVGSLVDRARKGGAI